MKLTRLLELAVAGTLVLMLVALLAGHVLGYPVLLAYVESDSMEPTLNEGDGFVAVPGPLAGDVGTGAVIVFEPEQMHGGDLTTHRVVDERADGYVTQGDGNIVTDQSGGEPLVTDGQVRAVALSVDGTVVRIPHLGTGVEAVGSLLDRAERTVAGLFGAPRLGSQQLAYLLFALGVLAFGATFVGDTSGERDRSRSRSRSLPDVVDNRLVLAGALVLLCGGAMVGMVAPAGTETYGIVSSESDSPNPTIIPSGGSDSFEYQVHNGGFLPTVSHMEPESSGIEVEPDHISLGTNETANATVTFHAPEETGYYLRSMTEYRYFAILPPAVIERAYAIHPWVPYTLILAVIVTPFLTLWLLLGGSQSTVRIRHRTRDRTDGFFDRVLND